MSAQQGPAKEMGLHRFMDRISYQALILINKVVKIPLQIKTFPSGGKRQNYIRLKRVAHSSELCRARVFFFETAGSIPSVSPIINISITSRSHSTKKWHSKMAIFEEHIFKNTNTIFFSDAANGFRCSHTIQTEVKGMSIIVISLTYPCIATSKACWPPVWHNLSFLEAQILRNVAHCQDCQKAKEETTMDY